jgi:hypothetical protein
MPRPETNSLYEKKTLSATSCQDRKPSIHLKKGAFKRTLIEESLRGL